jgi:Transmembrane secretion effector
MQPIDSGSQEQTMPNAIALNSSLVNMARVLGPGLGGLLIAWLGIAPLFLLNTISFIAVIIGTGHDRSTNVARLAQ